MQAQRLGPEERSPPIHVHPGGQNQVETKGKRPRAAARNVAYIDGQRLVANLFRQKIIPPEMNVLQKKIGRNANMVIGLENSAVVAAPQQTRGMPVGTMPGQAF